MRRSFMLAATSSTTVGKVMFFDSGGGGSGEGDGPREVGAIRRGVGP